MGKINEYQRQKLASAAVGTHEPSQAGQIIGRVVSQFGATVRQGEKEFARKQDKFYELQANNKLMHWSLSLNKTAKGLQAETAQNPSAYPTKLLEEGEKLINTYAENIENDAVKSKFIAGASRSLKNTSTQALNWAFDKQEENALIDIKDSLELAVIDAGAGPSFNNLQGAIESINDVLFDMSDPDVDKISDSERKEIYNKTVERAFQAHMAARLGNEPGALLGDLAQGDYDNAVLGVERTVGDKTTTVNVRLPMTDKLKREYRSKAIKAIDKGNYQQRLEQIFQQTGESFKNTLAWSRGEIDVGDIQKELDRAKADPNTTAEYREATENRLKVALMRVENAEDDPRVLTDLNLRMRRISREIAEIEDVVKEKGPDVPKAKRNAVEITTDLLRLESDILKAHWQEKLSRFHKNAWIKEILPTLFQGILSQEEEGQTGWIAKKFGAKPYRDKYGSHYVSITDQVNKISGLSEEEKEKITVTAFRYFIEEVMDQKEASPYEKLTDDQYRTAEKKAMNDIKQRFDPSYRFYKVGDTTPKGDKIIGFNEAGQPIVETTEEIRNEIRSGAN
jgi:hypothetical protein